MKTLLAGLLITPAVVGAVLATASTAAAIPIGGFGMTYHDGGSVTIHATAYSPRSASCGARYRVAIGGYDNSTASIVTVRARSGRFNVCRGATTSSSYPTYGTINAGFNVRDLVPPRVFRNRRYAIYVGAVQSVNGVDSSHSITRWRYLSPVEADD